MDLFKVLENGCGLQKLSRVMDIKKSTLEKELAKLIKEHKVIYDRAYAKYHAVLEGTLSVTNERFGFITPLDASEDSEDVYVNVANFNGALDGDTVRYYTYTDYYKNEIRRYAVIIEITVHGKLEFVGQVKFKKNKKGTSYYLVDTRNALAIKPILVDSDFNKVVPGMIVRAKLDYSKKNKIYAEVIEVLGNIDDPGIEISTIAASYGFAKDFPEEVKEEVTHIGQSVSEKELSNRRDFRDLQIITIDGDDSKDFDDAINVAKLENGNYRLGVYIADVANYVRASTALDDEAFKRGTSVYLADRVIPMLPHELSNGICSLNEGVDRLVMAITMEIDKKGDCQKYEINEGVIRSCHRMTYNKVNKILKGDEELINEYQDIHQMLLEMNELHQILRQKREAKGSLEFEINEYRFSLNEDGSPKAIELRVRDEAEKLIEDFMVYANEMVAYHLSISELPCLYRVHEQPDQEKLRDVFSMITNMGVELKMTQNDIHPKQIQQALDKINDTPSSTILNQLLLRSMMKAKYQPENLGHYGLALKYYCHFTSPIRRYPDLIVHRILKDLIINPTDFSERYKYYEHNLPQIGLKTSSSERRSIECEREVNDMLQAWYMESHLKEYMKGMITSITNFGMFVTLDSGVEGLIHVRDMDGYARFDEDRMTMVVEEKEYHLGDIVDIYVVGADRKTGKVDFIFADDAKKAMEIEE